jgi:hypothetical protein
VDTGSSNSIGACQPAGTHWHSDSVGVGVEEEEGESVPLSAEKESLECCYGMVR